MKKLQAFALWCKRKYGLLAEKKYTTIAGTLVFFLILSVTPFAFWLTLIFGRLTIDAESILKLPVFESVKNILEYIQKEAANATTGASIFLVATTLYSATNLFYHMRRSGEIIYAYKRKKHGFLVRLSALFLMFAVMFLTVVFTALLAGGAFIFSRIFPKWLELTCDYLLMLGVSFFLALILNFYVCPYRTKIKEILPGTLITVGAWSVALIGFTVYLKIGNMGKLYGALSAIIVFMLWLYVLMICFVSGVIFNSERVSARESKKL